MSLRTELLRNRSGSIATLGAVVLAILIGIAALAVDLGNWYVARADAQRTADMAAIGGAFTYAGTLDAKKANFAAADAAELNGAKGGATDWNGGTNTLTDNMIVTQLVTSPRNPANQAIETTVSTNLPLMLAQVFTSTRNVTISASSWAEITPANAGPACVLALAQLGTGVANDLTIGGNANLNLSGCTLRSDADIDVFGAANVAALGVYAAGSIAGTNLINTTPKQGQLFSNAGVIADPYAGDAALQNAFAQLPNASGPNTQVAPNNIAALQPGIYSSLDIQGTANLQPGTYIVNGPVTFDSQSNVAGNGVTIIASGSVTINGGASLNLIAPGADATLGVPGVVLASNSSAQAKINGGANSAFQGALYFPSANITFTGNSANGAAGCTQLVAYTITFKGSATLGSSCSNAGTTVINSATGVTLVQ